MFYKNITKKDGLQILCKQCVKEYKQKNKEKISDKMKIYYQLNKQKLAKYHQDNKHRILCYKKEYGKLNKEKLAEQKSRYYKSIKGKATLKNSKHKRRTIKKQGDIDTNKLLEFQQNAKVCYWCNKSLKNKVVHIDHYVPLAKGGEHTLSNLVVSCQSCNNRKHAKDPIVFANSMEKLL